MARRRPSKFKRRSRRVRRSPLLPPNSTHARLPTDIDLTFKATVMRAVAPFDETEEVEKPTPDDQNKTFRTRFICAWLLMNTILGTSARRRARYGQKLTSSRA